ncbi:hypothetical protein GP5015_1035 [gamma proteobacterium HTCC5015]|nr:hypothetical protein GP5015_1035 [gamma proteobacterium HTCC5015]
MSKGSMGFHYLLSTLALISFLIVPSVYAQVIDVDYSNCDEHVTVAVKEADVQKVLEVLSDQLGFELLKSQKVSKSVNLSGRFSQEVLLQKVLAGTNHFVSQSPSRDCGGQLKVSEVILLAPGETVMDPGVQRYLPKVNQKNQGKTFQHIADMRTYAREVKNKERKARKAHMTPEQRTEFMYHKKRLNKSDESE